MIAGACCTAAPLVVDCGGTGLYIVNLQWQINATYLVSRDTYSAARGCLYQWWLLGSNAVHRPSRRLAEIAFSTFTNTLRKRIIF